MIIGCIGYEPRIMTPLWPVTVDASYVVKVKAWRHYSVQTKISNRLI
jgi:hypothetical protein